MFGGGAEGGHSHAHDGVEIAEEDDAALRASFADAGAEREHIVQRDTARDGTLAGAMDHRAVGKRVAKGDAKLDDLRAVVDGGERDVVRRFERWVACGEIDD